ncbi:hypothetical protein COLO4_25969 [Corchorus olitorius]|uniref:TF-B3 domain-containing protein n=1 Tax=Corchorus olitorius TaxID=93759 RepID=A0A1R3HZ68_9ROSI|nr:hypothetical protein COLO4_25969 [Corchorus olitorius]
MAYSTTSKRVPAVKESTSLHFFKLISADNGLNDLQLPKKFVERFGHELISSSVATLILPNGKEFEVGLKKDADGMIWFHDKWDEFVEYSSIRPKYFLVFKYERNSTFKKINYDVIYEVIDVAKLILKDVCTCKEINKIGFIFQAC